MKIVFSAQSEEMMAFVSNKTIAVKSETNEEIKFQIVERGINQVQIQLNNIGNASTVFVTFI